MRRDRHRARLADWNRQLIEDERADNPMDAAQLRERMRLWLAASYRAVIFEVDGRSVGYALYLPDEEGIYLRQLFVDRAQRRRGIGRRAVERLRTQVFPPGMPVTLRVLVHNEPAPSFWRALGFADHTVTLTVRAFVEWARSRGATGVTLSTFRDVPWNAPFYEHLGFRALDPTGIRCAAARAGRDRRGAQGIAGGATRCDAPRARLRRHRIAL